MGNGGMLALEIAMGIGLAACAGLRAFLPLLVVGLAGRMGWVGLSDSFRWLASWPALVVFGVAVLTEILSDKIPVVDHMLDVIGGALKPAAGALLAASVLSDLGPLQATVLGILVGGSSAGAVHLVKAKVRLFSSVTTAGLGNPFLSFGEDLAALAGSVIAIVLPVLLLGVVIATLLFFLVVRRRFRLRAERLGR